jgi:hypothetical protein
MMVGPQPAFPVVNVQKRRTERQIAVLRGDVWRDDTAPCASTAAIVLLEPNTPFENSPSEDLGWIANTGKPFTENDNRLSDALSRSWSGGATDFRDGWSRKRRHSVSLTQTFDK